MKSPDDVLLTINQIQPINVAFAVAERFLPEIQKQMRSHTLTVTATFENLEGPPPYASKAPPAARSSRRR